LDFFGSSQQKFEEESQTNSLFPPFTVIPDAAQLLTSLMLCARPEYLQLLQQAKFQAD
jgi:hypothetical protein